MSVVDGGGNTFQTSDTSIQVADAVLTDTTPVANVGTNAYVAKGSGQIVLATFTDGNPDAQASDFSVDVEPARERGLLQRLLM